MYNVALLHQGQEDQGQENLDQLSTKQLCVVLDTTGIIGR